jgi:hypothetical protein
MSPAADQAADAFLERCSGLRLHLGDLEAIREIASHIRSGCLKYDIDRKMLITKNLRIRVVSGFDPQSF